MSAHAKRQLAGQSVVILGGSGAMGSASAAELAAMGARTILVGRDEAKLKALAEDLEGDVIPLVADVTRTEELERALRASGPIDHVVVAVAANASASSVGDTSSQTAQKAFGRYWVGYEVLHLAPKLLRRGGSVTLLSGSSARTPAPGYGVWTALHGAIEALARAAAIDIAPIRVNVVSPGGIGLKADRQLIERYGKPSDIGAAIAALVANPAITGAVLDVDSGERKGTWNGETSLAKIGDMT